MRPLGSIWGTLGRPLGGHLELWRDPRALIFACQELSCALQGCQECPRRLQERPRKLLERPRGLPEVSKRSPRGSKRPPKGLLKASKRVQEASKRPPRGFERVSSKSNGCPGGFLDVSSGSRESICFKLRSEATRKLQLMLKGCCRDHQWSFHLKTVRNIPSLLP